MFRTLLVLLLCSRALTQTVHIRLTEDGRVLQPDGSNLEDYEVQEENPELAKYLSLGKFAFGTLKKAGYAFGSLVDVSAPEQEQGEDAAGASAKRLFPLTMTLTVSEEGLGTRDGGAATSEDVGYQVVLEYDPKKYRSRVAVTRAARLGTAGADGESSSEAVPLPLPAPEEPPFLERNKQGIIMMCGVIIAASVVRMLRKGLQGLISWYQGKGAAGPPAAAAPANGEGAGGSACKGKGKGKGKGKAAKKNN